MLVNLDKLLKPMRGHLGLCYCLVHEGLLLMLNLPTAFNGLISSGWDEYQQDWIISEITPT